MNFHIVSPSIKLAIAANLPFFIVSANDS